MDIYISNSFIDGVVALVGGGQANATIIDHSYTIIDTCSNTNDSCKLDTATVGKLREVFNNGLEDMELFPAVGEEFYDGINAMGINAPYIIGAGNGIKLRCFTIGQFRIN